MKKETSKKIVTFFLNLFHIKLSDKKVKLLTQIFSFCIVGFIATVIDIGLLYILKDICNLPLIISNTLSFSISVVYNYWASKKYVYDVDKSKDNRKTFIQFVVFSVIGLLLNNTILYLLTNIINMYYLLSKAIATIIVMIFNFITRKKFLE